MTNLREKMQKYSQMMIIVGVILASVIWIGQKFSDIVLRMNAPKAIIIMKKDHMDLDDINP